MRLVLDACVLYPNVMRSALLAVAGTGAYVPLWSPRLLEEWRRAAHRKGPDIGVMAEGEIAMLSVHWPDARRPEPQALDRFWLPDENDVHVLGLAVAQSADGIVTVNAKDFPRHILAEEGLVRWDPDLLIVQSAAVMPQKSRAALLSVYQAGDGAGQGVTPRAFFKKARLPRTGKWLDANA